MMIVEMFLIILLKMKVVQKLIDIMKMSVLLEELLNELKNYLIVLPCLQIQIQNNHIVK